MPGSYWQVLSRGMTWVNCLWRNIQAVWIVEGQWWSQERYLERHCNNQGRDDNGVDLDSSRGGGEKSHNAEVFWRYRGRGCLRNQMGRERGAIKTDSSSRKFGLSLWKNKMTEMERPWRGWNGGDGIQQFNFGCAPFRVPIQFPCGCMKQVFWI